MNGRDSLEILWGTLVNVREGWKRTILKTNGLESQGNLGGDAQGIVGVTKRYTRVIPSVGTKEVSAIQGLNGGQVRGQALSWTKSISRQLGFVVSSVAVRGGSISMSQQKGKLQSGFGVPLASQKTNLTKGRLKEYKHTPGPQRCSPGFDL